MHGKKRRRKRRRAKKGTLSPCIRGETTRRITGYCGNIFFGPKLEKPVKRSFDETFAHVHAQLMTGNLPLRKHSEDMSGHYEVFVHLLQRLYAERWSGDSGVSCRELLDAAGPWRPDNTWGHSGFWRWSPQREAWNALVDREFPRAAKPE